MAVEEASLKSCLLPLAIAGVMAAAGYAVFTAQSGGADAFADGGAPYLDALVRGDWAGAAEADHPVRDARPDALGAAWTARQERLGDLTSWSLHVVNPGQDSDGPFLRAESILTFEEASGPVGLNLVLRPHGGVYRVHSASPPPRSASDDGLW